MEDILGGKSFGGKVGREAWNFIYNLRTDGTCAIAGHYNRNVVKIKIPAFSPTGHRVTEIGDFAFSGYERLKRVTVKGGVKRIGNGAFFECKNLVRVKMSDSVNEIGDSAFDGCTRLKKRF